jgi:hypothetical protein
MVDWFRKKAPPKSPRVISETLFGDMSLDAWVKNTSDGEPWTSFKTAKNAIDRDDRQTCSEILKEIVSRPGLESRHYAQGWHLLRQLGVRPPPKRRATTCLA